MVKEFKFGIRKPKVKKPLKKYRSRWQNKFKLKWISKKKGVEV
jgi:hypothetical protein